MTKFQIPTYRMLSVLDYMVEKQIAKDREDAALQIGVRRSDASAVDDGNINFTLSHIEAACRISGASADYLFGFTDTMARQPSKDPLEAMKDALIALQTKFNESPEK